MFGIFSLLFFAFVVNKGNSFSKENIEGTRIQNADLKAKFLRWPGSSRERPGAQPCRLRNSRPPLPTHSEACFSPLPHLPSSSHHHLTAGLCGSLPTGLPSLTIVCSLNRISTLKLGLSFFFFFFRVIFPKCKCKLFHCFPLPLR